MDKRDTILIVDDMEINRAILRGLFERDYNVLEAENGQQALMLLQQYHSAIAVMLLDVVMPNKDGYQVLLEMGEGPLLAEVPVVVITAEGSAENEVRAFDLGASDIIMKPFEPYVVKRRVQNIVELNRHKLHLEDLVEEQARSLRESNEVMLDALSSIIEYRNLESGQHILRIRMFTKILLEDVARTYQEFNLDQRKIEAIAAAAAMHDIGKIAIPDAILNKPGPLTWEEFEVMKTHSMKGCEILSGLDRMSNKEYLHYAYNICRYHHERWDGRGYPDGLKGDNIPVCAQVVGIADAYDALTTDRVYKKAFPHEQAYNMILNGDCGIFSPKLLECVKNVRTAFQNLAREYADGRSPKMDHIMAEVPELRHSNTLDTLQLAQMKYFTLLHYVDSTVVEVDYSSGIYHIVYIHNSDFELLRTGSCFEESVRNFERGAVHPDDRTVLVEAMTTGMQTLFQDGMMRRTEPFRLVSRITGAYRQCRVTALRMDTGDPRQHRALVLWSEAGSAGDEPIRRAKTLPETADEVLLRGMLGGVQKRRNDQALTLVTVNEGFVNLVGYDQREIKEQFKNRYLNLIYPADRDEVQSQIREQLRCGNTVELEYRVVTQSGRLVWLLDRGQLIMGEEGTEYFCCLLLDITQSKTAQEELRLTLERHRIIMEQSNDVIFEWDIAKDQIIYSDNWMGKFGYQPIREQITTQIPLVSHLNPEDIPGFMGLARDMASGLTYGETELRIAKADGRYIWCKIRATAQFDAEGHPIKAVGVLLDIDDEKRAAQALQDRAERDALTKLYNKSAIRRQVDSFLAERKSGTRAAMLIIDVDSFKQINDKFGHMFGDAVLTEIAVEIRKQFRGGDAVSRIGGDEFMVFMPNITGTEIVEERAQRMITGFQGMFRESLGENRLSCSIGVSLCPEDGINFQDLFQRADRALYRAKDQGKNQYVLYEKSAIDKAFIPATNQTAVSARIDSDDAAISGSDTLIQQAFRQLYEADDVEQAVGAILALVGTQFNISRCYIFELSRDGTQCHDTFEWCNKSIPTGLGAIHPISAMGLGGYYPDNFNESGIYYCPNIAKLPKIQRGILERQGIKSMLQCAIRDNGVFKGYVGFDDCTVMRMWNREQIDAITFISELISTFLLKKRAQDRAVETAQDLRAALDNQNAWIYIVDPESYQLQYINAKTQKLIPEALVGMTCHKIFQKRDTPCEQCPMRNSRETINCTMELFNEALGIWTLTDASLIRWGEKNACMISCHDITRYKAGKPEI